MFKQLWRESKRLVKNMATIGEHKSVNKITIPEHPLQNMVRVERLPHIWCPGCGLGILLQVYLRAIKDKDPNQIVTISGIGCTGRFSGYVNADGFHTTHGRAIPFAFGVKTARPDLEVVVISGDGDLFSIGGNHFIHIMRRQVDITIIAVNNHIYGLTGGQTAPTTPHLALTKTTPEGAKLYPFNLPHLAKAAGAQYIARYTILQQRMLVKTIKKAIETKGPAFVEIVAPCDTLFGRYQQLEPIPLYHSLKEASKPLTAEQKKYASKAPIIFDSLNHKYVSVPYGEFEPLKRVE